VVGEIEPNDTLPVLDTVQTEDEGEWVQVTLPDGTEGFVQAPTVRIEEATGTTQTVVTPGEGEGKGVVTAAGTTNVLAEPNPDAETVGEIESNIEVIVLEIVETEADGNWLSLRLGDGTEGFVPAETISVSDFGFLDIVDAGTVTETPVVEEPGADPTQVAALEIDTEAGEGIGVARIETDVRAGPDESFEVIATLQPDEVVALRSFEFAPDVAWLRARLQDGTIGYVRGDEVIAQVFPELNEPFEEVVAGDDGEGLGVVIASASANVRAGAGSGFDVLAAANPDEIVAILGVAQTEDEGEWLNIRLPDGTEGWISADLVRVDLEPGTTVAVIPTEPTFTPSFTPSITPTLSPTPTFTPTVTDTPTDEPPPTDTPTDEPTDEPTATNTPTDEPTATDTPTDEPTLTPTAEPTETPTPTDEPTDEPTLTPTDEPTAVSADFVEGFGVVQAEGNVNVRSGPSSTFDRIGVVPSNQRLTVLAIVDGDDGDQWVQVRLPDGTEGFLSETLFNVVEAPQGVVAGATTVAQADGPTETPTQAAEGTVTEVASVTETEVTEEAVVTPDVTLTPMEVAGIPEGAVIVRSVEVPPLNVVETSGETVILFTQPDDTAEVVGQLAPEQSAPFISSEDEWVQLRVPGTGEVAWAQAASVTTVEDGQSRPFAAVTGPANNPVYTEPDITSEEIGRYLQNTQFDVFGVSDDEAWLQVRTPDGRIGWVEATITELTGDPASAATFPTASINGEEALTAYATPDETGTELGEIGADVVVDVLGFAEDDNDWVQVRLPDGRSGFARFDSLALSANVTETLQLPPTNVDTEEQLARTTLFGPFYAENAGEASLTPQRQELAVRVGLIVSALLIALGNLFYAVARTRN
jgi:uncharacterized protein YgiM (DUF1202 family)